MMINETAIPNELKQFPNWVTWRAEERDGKKTKVPYTPRTRRLASSTDPKTWGTFEDALADYHDGSPADGIGFVFTDSPFCGVDLDHVLDGDGKPDETAAWVVAGLRSYTERSPGGDGLHVIVEADLPPGRRRRKGKGESKIEVYDTGRYFTVTGDHWPGTPQEIGERQAEIELVYEAIFAPEPEPPRESATPQPVDLDDRDLLDKATSADDGARFTQLWNGDISGYDSQSEADLALCNLLAFWTGGDRARMDRLFRQSGLYRDKWDRKDYSEKTLGLALKGRTEFYTPERKEPRPLGARLTQDEVERVKVLAIPSPDPGLQERIVAALLEREPDGKRLRPALLRKQKAGRLALGWLQENGGFVRSEGDELFYFYRGERRLYNLESDRWTAWLYSLTGVNPAGGDFAHILADCKTMATTAPRRRIVRVAAWDDEAQTLRVSRFDGTVYVLDGEEIIEEANGEAVLFDDALLWTPYAPNFDGKDSAALHWQTTQLPYWEGCTTHEDDDDETRGQKGERREMYGLALRAWELGTFFSELCPTRPMLPVVGEKGSGKTMTLRLFLRFLFGPLAEVSGVPDKPDGFTAAAAAAHVLVLDNLDDFRGWLRDKLARLSTGGIDEYRRLYTSNEVGRVHYRCWLAFTSRTPDTLRRDDLADRLVLLPVERIGQETLQAERDFLAQADAVRGCWWGDVLSALNRVVAAIRQGKLKSESKLRMADWESLGRVIAQVEGKEELWDAFVDDLQTAQAAFLLEGDLIVEGLQLWLADPLNHGREVTARELRQELTEELFGDKALPSDWPKSAVGFGKRMAGIRRELKAHFKTEWGQGTGKARDRTVYRLWPQEGGEVTEIQR